MSAVLLFQVKQELSKNVTTWHVECVLPLRLHVPQSAKSYAQVWLGQVRKGALACALVSWWCITWTQLVQWGLWALRHGIQISMEAILACHPARSTEWLDCHPKWCEQWRRPHHELVQLFPVWHDFVPYYFICLLCVALRLLAIILVQSLSNVHCAALR